MSDLDRMSEDGDATTSQQPGTTITDDENDPIVATYSVFIKPALPKHRKLVVLEYVNKTSPDPNQLQQPRVLELRVKPNTGMIEVDVPIDTSDAYDKNKGIQWGVALQKSMEAKKGGSLGLAGGFGVGAAPPPRTGGRRGGGGGGGNDDEAPQLTWAEAARLDKVLRKQTLGGGRSAEEENTKHMVGVFQGKNIHLTPVSSVVHLRPVGHHIDASVEQERLSRPQPGGAGAGPGGAGGAADKSAGRAIHMTLKAAMDEDGVTAETMADRLRSVQKEHWKRMEYVHDESDAAWSAYNESLLLRSDQLPGTEGKGKEPATGDDDDKNGDESGSPELVSKVSRLQTDWGEDELLRAVSGISRHDKKPGEEAIALSQSQAALAAKMAASNAIAVKGKGKAPAAVEPKTEPPVSPAKRRAGRPGKSAAGARGKAAGAGSAAGNAMEID